MKKQIFRNDWQDILIEEMDKGYYKNLRNFLINEYKNSEIYPNMHDIFNAFHMSSFMDTKVVILGQDPYHGTGQAHGIAFSVQDGVQLPPSLVNIFRELYNDLGITASKNGCLISWAKQGVLLLNAVLTVRKGHAGSHSGQGWEIFTDHVIQLLGKRDKPIVFLLWGNYARSKKYLIVNKKHLVLEAAHPSPLSANKGFFGSRPFSKTNEFLRNIGETPINWQLH